MGKNSQCIDCTALCHHENTGKRLSFAAGCLGWRMSFVGEWQYLKWTVSKCDFSSSISRRSLELTPLSHICAPSISSPSASVKPQALLTSRPSLVKRDWLDYLRETGKSCLLFWTKTRADTSRRRSSSKESSQEQSFCSNIYDCEWLTKWTLPASDVSSRISLLARGNWLWPRPRLWWLQEIRTVTAGLGWKVGASGETAFTSVARWLKKPAGLEWSCPLVSAETSAQESSFKFPGKILRTSALIFPLWLVVVILSYLWSPTKFAASVSPPQNSVTSSNRRWTHRKEFSPCWTFYWKSRSKDKRPQ